ncbi:VirK/YbjX family protein [Vibrio profundum]|uniref:DUF535 family protein n=1 Tax=Vibrio profundum TaxID=2910247 RepID=UPI003D0B387D
MSIQYIRFLKSLPSVAHYVYPDIQGVKKFRYNFRFCVWAMLKPNIMQQMQTTFSQPEMTLVAKNNPRIFEKPLKPFVCLKWRPKQRAQRILEHFQVLQQQYGQAFLNFYSDDGWDLLDVLDYKVVLCAGPDREGSLALKLIDTDHLELFTISFNISSTPRREIHIGALQGPGQHIEERGEIIKGLTRGVHGLRPKALLLECLLMLARSWQVEKVYGISNKGHVYQALRYMGSKRSSVSYNYADLWQDYGGTPVSKYLYEIPLQPQRKDPSELKKTKRRLYTKRYKWLDEAEQSIHGRLLELER